MSVEPITCQTENTQQNPLQTQVSFLAGFFTEQTQNPNMELQQKVSGISLLEHTQAAKERLKLQHQKKVNFKRIVTKIRTGTQSIFRAYESMRHCSSRR